MLVQRTIEERLSVQVLSFSKLSGGDINEVYQFSCSLGKFVIKCNSRLQFPEMLRKEAQGLSLLNNNGLNTPELIDQFEDLNQQFLILEYIEEGKKTKDFWTDFGECLAGLHQNSHSKFGLDHHNYIGSLKQQNDQFNSWDSFFIEQRIQPLVKMAFDRNLFDKKHLRWFEGFYNAFSELIPTELPSLLHGDLWSGNLLCDSNQSALFIDPAVYYGHREMDIAMTRMFGGFDFDYLEAYHSCFPLENEWEKRIPIHNLYPQLVHLVLFGKSYLNGIENVVKRF